MKCVEITVIYYRVVVGQHVSGGGEVVGHLNLSMVEVADGGHYSCTATNTAASVTHQAPLHVYGGKYGFKLLCLTIIIILFLLKISITFINRIGVLINHIIIILANKK